jgi:hypothetical protein
MLPVGGFHGSSRLSRDPRQHRALPLVGLLKVATRWVLTTIEERDRSVHVVGRRVRDRKQVALSGEKLCIKNSHWRRGGPNLGRAPAGLFMPAT